MLCFLLVACYSLLFAQGSANAHDKPLQDSNVRLPKSIRPLHYEVWLKPFVRGNFSIEGNVKIDLQIDEETNKIVLHILDIKTKNDTVKIYGKKDAKKKEIAVTKMSFDSKREFLIIDLAENLTVGQIYILELSYEGILDDRMVGFYRAPYVGRNETRWIALTQFQATDARRAIPCFDEPQLKATFDIRLARPAYMKTGSNMPLSKSLPISDQPDWYWDYFETSVPMSSYLVAFFVADFEYSESPEGEGTKIKVWCDKSDLPNSKLAVSLHSKLLKFFAEYFDVPFPLPELDVFATPELSFWAMENWGLITYRDRDLLLDEKNGSPWKKYALGINIAHELAHQWFGNLVTMKWWSELWLNEGFATFMSFFAMARVEPESYMQTDLLSRQSHKGLLLDSLDSSHPIHVPVADPADINEIFDDIAYAKGASLVNMMEHFLTEPTFKKGLSQYLKELQYQNAEQSDLWRFLMQAAIEDKSLADGVTVSDVMKSWTLQEGYPIVEVSRSANGDSAQLHQERFYLIDKKCSDGICEKFEDNSAWWVPVSWTHEDKPEFNITKPSFWMVPKTLKPMMLTSLPNAYKWIILNIQQTGFYRVNYDVRNWQLLIRQLHINHSVIHQANRAQLIDDAFNLARAGRLDYSLVLELIGYLGKERDLIAWEAALVNLQYVENRIMRTSTYGAFKKYLLSLISPTYSRLGFVDNPSESLEEKRLRSLIAEWACRLGHKKCNDDARQAYADFKKGTSILVKNTEAIAMCAEVQSGGAKAWDDIWRLLSERKGSRTSVIAALACSRESWIISRYLEISMKRGSGIPKTDASEVFKAVSANPTGNYLAWNFLRSNWKSIAKYMGSTNFQLSHLVKSAIRFSNSALDVQEMEIFRDNQKGHLGSASRAVDQALENARINQEWSETKLPIFNEWLQERGFGIKLASNRLELQEN